MELIDYHRARNAQARESHCKSRLARDPNYLQRK